MKLRKAGRGSSAVAEATSRVGIQAAVAAAVAGAVTIRVRAMAVSVMEEMLQKRKTRRPCPHDRHTISEPKAPQHLPPQAVQHDPPQPVRKQLPRDISPQPQPRKNPSHASAVADSATATGNLTGACVAQGGWAGDWAADGGRFDDRGWTRFDWVWIRYWCQQFGITPPMDRRAIAAAERIAVIN